MLLCLLIPFLQAELGQSLQYYTGSTGYVPRLYKTENDDWYKRGGNWNTFYSGINRYKAYYTTRPRSNYNSYNYVRGYTPRRFDSYVTWFGGTPQTTYSRQLQQISSYSQPTLWHQRQQNKKEDDSDEKQTDQTNFGRSNNKVARFRSGISWNLRRIYPYSAYRRNTNFVLNTDNYGKRTGLLKTFRVATKELEVKNPNEKKQTSRATFLQQIAQEATQQTKFI